MTSDHEPNAGSAGASSGLSADRSSVEAPRSYEPAPRAIADPRGALRTPLVDLRRRARRLLVIQRGAALLAIALVAALALGLADYALRLPTGMRWVLLVGGIAALAAGFDRWVLPALRFAPTLTDVALRVERVYPTLRGRLASALEFAEWRAGERSAVESGLASRVVEKTAADVRRVKARHLLKPQRARRGALALGGAAALALVPATLASTLFLTGAARLFAPWADAQWPKRTGVIDATTVEVHPLGTALPVRAALTRSPREPERTDVSVQHRAIVGGEPGPIRRELLTYQGRAVEAQAPTDDRDGPTATTGALFERLLEPTGEAVEYRFVTEDDQTAWRRVRLVEPPAVERARATITPPAYARELFAAGGAVSGSEGNTLDGRQIDLGAGADDRAFAPPALVGSRVELTITLNKPAMLKPSSRDGSATSGAREGVDPRDGLRNRLATADADAQVEMQGAEISAAFTLGESVRLPIELVDEFGIASADRAVFRFEASPDRPASATITTPDRDLTALPSAVIEVEAEGRDDVGLASLAIRRQTFSPAGGDGSQPSGPGGALEPDAEPTTVVTTGGEGRRTVRTGFTLELGLLDVEPGDAVELVALAADVLSVSAEAGERAGPTRSALRTIRVISDAEFVDQVRAELAGVRQAAIRAEQQQQELQDQAETEGATRRTRRGQAQIGDRLAQQREALSELQQRVDRNRLDDDSLRQMLERAQQALSRAGASSAAAAERLDDAAARAARDAERDPEAGVDEQLTDEEAREVEREQQRVRDELAELVRMLDRGEDAWVVRNTLERLVREQQRLREETQQLGEQTAGQERDELSPEQRDELDRIAQEQEDLARQTRQAIEQMRQRADELQQSDPATSAGLDQAAQGAEENRAAESMEQAAQAAEQNQTSTAQQGQQQAQEALEQALEDLEETERARAEVLKRVLQSAIESLEQLVEDQSAELAALNAAVAAGEPLAPLDAGMIRLNRNTLGVVDLLRADQSLSAVASVVQRASGAQGEAIRALRAAPADAEAARAAETRSLDLLEQALQRARDMQEEMEQEESERQRRELERAYEEALRRQVALRETAEPFAEAERLSRRERREMRQLSTTQREVVDALRAIPEISGEFSTFQVFVFVHDRAVEAAEAAADALQGAQASRAIDRQRRVEALLRQVLDALDDPPVDDQPFAQGGQQGGGGGGGGGGQQPQPLIEDLAQLRLLRMMQMDLAERTRLADAGERAAARQVAGELAGEQSRLAELAAELILQQQGGPPPDEAAIGGGEPLDLDDIVRNALDGADADDDNSTDDANNDEDDASDTPPAEGGS